MDQEAEGKEELSMKLRNVSLFRYSVVVVLLIMRSSRMCGNFLVLFGVSYYDHRYKKKTINRLTMM